MPDFFLTAGFVGHKYPTYSMRVAQATHAFYPLRLLRLSEKIRPSDGVEQKTDNLPMRACPKARTLTCLVLTALYSDLEDEPFILSAIEFIKFLSFKISEIGLSLWCFLSKVSAGFNAIALIIFSIRTGSNSF